MPVTRHAASPRWPRAVWLVVICALAIVLLHAEPMPAAVANGSTHLDAGALDRGGATTTIAKPVHEVVACLWIVLGFGGVLLAFATGVFAPVVAVLLAGAAMEVCS